MNPCRLREPKVINNSLLEKCAAEQGPKGEAGRLAEAEKIPLEDITQIRLEFQSILRIDHLWVVPALTKLNLNNNLIEVIENLDSLIHLVELNLSFNKIKKIENLESLTQLECLSLFDNQIEVLENMETLTKLTIFSIGKNRIEDMDSILYLRRFINLKSLNLVGNPCTDMEDFRLFIAVFLPQIVYYEYKLIYDVERELGHEKFDCKLRGILDHEAREEELREIERQEQLDAERNALSFVEYLNSRHLFDAMFLNDNDGRSFFDMGEEAKEFYNEYEEQFVELCKDIFLNGQTQFQVREKELQQFLQCVEDAKKQNQDDSIAHMEEFLGKKAVLFYDLKGAQKELDSNHIKYEEFIEKSDQLLVAYDQMLHELWKKLMKLELQLYEQLEEVNQNFEHGMTELVNQFIESAQTQFTFMRDLEASYSENIGEFAMRYQTMVMSDEITAVESLKAIMGDKDLLHNALAASHDLHLQIIDGREDLLSNNAKDWLQGLVENLAKSEVIRNRSKILEINHFLDIQKEEFEALNAEYVQDYSPTVEE